MNKPKNIKTWRIVGIIVTALIIIAGFAGAYALGVNRGALMDGEWEHPMSRYNEDGEGYYPMPMYGYGMTRGYRSPIGSIFGFFLMILVVGAFIRLLFFPFRMARRALWGHHYGCHPRHHFHHMPPRGYYGPRGSWDEACCGEKGPEAEEESSEE